MPGKRVAVILAGCGNRDGSEITEAVSTLIALSEAGAEYRVFAPNTQFEVLDFLHSPPTHTGETRSVLQESARIARGEIEDIKKLKSSEFDALAFPGGTGVARNLCNWFSKGAQCSVNPDVERAIQEFYKEEKPIAAICIAPALISRVLGEKGITVTVGAADETAAEIAKTGAQHEVCAVDDFVTDRDHRIVTSPAYMYGDAKPHQVFNGIRGAIRELVEMA
jgi:enhancing lycopene biosynthesis protein 2